MKVAFVLRGQGHEEEGFPCQDACLVERGKAKAWLALADGAGSCSHSQFGADACVKAMRSLLWKYRGGWNSISSEEILQQLRKVLSLIAQKHCCSLEDLSSTLLAVQVLGNRYIALHLGDGVLGTYRGDGSFSELSQPENGKFANHTYFVSSPDASKHLRLYEGELGDIHGFVAMSDGAAESLYLPQEHTFSPIIRLLLERLHCFGEDDTLKWFTPLFETYVRNRTTDDVSFVAFLVPSIAQSSLTQLSVDALRTVIGMEIDLTVCQAMLKVLKMLEGGVPISGKSLLRNLHVPIPPSELGRVFWKPLRVAHLVEYVGGGCYRLASTFLGSKECHNV